MGQRSPPRARERSPGIVQTGGDARDGAQQWTHWGLVTRAVGSERLDPDRVQGID